MIAIKNAGYNFRHEPSFRIDRPQGSGDFLLLIIRSDAYIVLNGERITIPKNCAILFKKNSPQFYGAQGGEYVNDWIHFDMDEKEQDYCEELQIPFDQVIPLQESTLLSKLIKTIVLERYSQNLHKNQSALHYFHLILLKLSERAQEQNRPQKHPYYNTLCNLRNEIFLAPQKPWDVDTVCKKANLSRSYFQHLYKSFFGKSIISDLQESRIEYAKYLLLSTTITVTSISEACGYNNDVHFMRVFKKSTGQTPTQYRAEGQQ